jgi:hypothetical protein
MRRDVQFILDRVSLDGRLGPLSFASAVIIAALASPLFEPIWSGPVLAQTASAPAWMCVGATAEPAAISDRPGARNPC